MSHFVVRLAVRQVRDHYLAAVVRRAVVGCYLLDLAHFDLNLAGALRKVSAHRARATKCSGHRGRRH